MTLFVGLMLSIKMVDAIVILVIMLSTIDANHVLRVQLITNKLIHAKVYAKKNKFSEGKDVYARKDFIILVVNVINVHLILSIIPSLVDVIALEDYHIMKG